MAQRIVGLLDGTLHSKAGRVPEAEVHFTETMAHLAALFREGTPIIGVCAAGILIRAVAPELKNKRTEPPVLAIAEDGSSVVPLLGGHHRANFLAQQITQELGGSAAVTTSGDLRFGIALDEPPDGLTLANPEDAKSFMAELLNGATLTMEGRHSWFGESQLPRHPHGSLRISVSERRWSGSTSHLVYHPRTLAIGVGCERGCDPDELWTLVDETLHWYHLAPESVAGVFSLEVKRDEQAVLALGMQLNRPVRFFDAATLDEQKARLLTPSKVVFREVGCHGVAEGAALAVVGPLGMLWVPKVRSARATCAIAVAPEPFEAEAFGVGQGQLFIVGLGPGTAEWRTPEARKALEAASDWVGYGLYLDLAADVRRDQKQHRFALGEETERVRYALNLAAEGRIVALISSGDPGIYAMATLVFELLEREAQPEWAPVAVSVVPGISAMHAAAARIGAPLGHDFCAISLSDLLTPTSVIKQRLHAAAQGDFVIALYNPVSRKRVALLVTARDILRHHRPPETPVVLARNLGRPDETLRVISLEELRPELIDMLTVVLIGSSQTRHLPSPDGAGWVYTPRGYARKSASGSGGDSSLTAAPKALPAHNATRRKHTARSVPQTRV